MPGLSCAERRKPAATKLTAGWERWLPSLEVALLVLFQNHFAALTRSLHCNRFSHLRNLHPGLVHDLVHHFVIVIGIVMEQQEPRYVRIGRDCDHAANRAVSPAEVPPLSLIRILLSD